MEVTESIARAALDTLSSEVAVLDEEGHILFTNRAWKEFESSEADIPERDMLGVNYLEAIDPTADEYAADAIEGIEPVLAGERDEFSFEYPCHSEENKHWFLMRATGFTIGSDTFATIAHIDITDRRLAELDAQDHAERAEQERANLEHLLNRINGLVQDITLLLVESTTREEIEAGVCDRLAATDPYLFAWIGEADLSNERIEPRVSSGIDTTPAPIEGPLDTATDPIAQAVVDGSVQVATGDNLGHDSVIRETAAASLIAVPLACRETSYGVLVVYAHKPDAFDEREQVVLAALGRAVANALNALESKRTLTADRIVELEFTAADDAIVASYLSAEADASLTYSGSVYQQDGSLRMFYTGHDGDLSSIVDTASEHPDVLNARRLTESDDESLFEFTVVDPLVARLADRGAATLAITAENGITRFTVELSQESDAKALFESIDERYDGTELVGYHEHERPVKTRQEFRADLKDRLTDRQLTALRTAYHSGFFDWPRSVDGDELAGMMDISRSTFHQHLRVAERKILDAFFEQS